MLCVQLVFAIIYHLLFFYSITIILTRTAIKVKINIGIKMCKEDGRRRKQIIGRIKNRNIAATNNSSVRLNLNSAGSYLPTIFIFK